MALDLAKFEATGTIHMQVRITAGNFERGNGQENLWASTDWTNDGDAGQVGTLEEGSADVTGISGNAPTISRFCRWDRTGGNDDRLILNAAVDGTDNLGALFDAAQDPYRVTFVRELPGGGHETHTLVSASSGGGSAFVDWRTANSHFRSAAWTALNAIASGDSVILAIHQGTASYGAHSAIGLGPVELVLEATVSSSQQTTPHEGSAEAALTLTPRIVLARHADHHIAESPESAELTLSALVSSAELTRAHEGSAEATLALTARVLAAGQTANHEAAGLAPVVLMLSAAGSIVAPPPEPLTGTQRWLTSLDLPWSNLPRRWAMTLATGAIAQRMIDAAGRAMRGWWPATARAAEFAVWARTLKLPRRSGESDADWLQRVALWKSEPVGTSGWVRDTVQRVTGNDPPKVIELPRDGMRFGVGGFPARFGAGPVVIVGVEPAVLAALADELEPGVPPDVGLIYLDEATFAQVS